MGGTKRKRTNGIYCEEHPDAHIVEDYSAGDMICSECGLVLADRVIDVSAEWRTFSNNDGSSKADPSRVGSAENPLLSQDLSTMIGPSCSTGGDNGVTKYSNRRNVNSSDRTLLAVFKIINNLSDKLNGLARVVNTANEIFKRIHDMKKTRGRSHEAFAAACLYVAFRKEQVPRTFKEICAVSSISSVEIKRCFNKIVKSALDKPLELTDNQDYIPRFCGNLGLPEEVVRAASYIASKAKLIDKLNARTPITIAASAIFLAVQGTAHQKSQKVIADSSGVGESTIKDVYRDMKAYLAQLLPSGL